MTSALMTKAEAITQGLSRFFTGRPCVRGHFAERNVRGGKCLMCNRLKSKSYRAAHPNQVQVRNLAYRTAHRSRLKEQARARRQVNLERYREYDRARHQANPGRVGAYRKANRDRINEQARARRQANPERYRASYKANRAQCLLATRAWQKANPDRRRQTRRGIDARRRGAAGTHSYDEIRSLYEKQGRLCANPYCRVSLEAGHHEDHIVPIAAGGSNYIENIQLLCAPCNIDKGAKHPALWLVEQEAKRGDGGTDA